MSARLNSAAVFWRKKKPDPRSSSSHPAPARKPHESAADSSASADHEDDTGTRFLTGDSDLDRRTVEVLLSTIARVSQSRDLEALLNDIVDRSIELTDAERGFLILIDSDVNAGGAQVGDPRVRVARTREGKPAEDSVKFSTSVVKRVLETRQPVLATVQSDSDALELGKSVFDLKLRAVMCVPLASRKGAEDSNRGVLYVDSRAATREFTHRDLGLFAALSQHIAIALENARLHIASLEKTRLEQSLELASAIQSGLMPRIPKDVVGLDIHGFYRPAERTSGDFFDFVRTKDKRLAVVVGDVSGHGVGPALVTSNAQGMLHASLRINDNPATALTMANQVLSERMDPGMFLTLLLLVFRDDGELEICNAGHHAAIIVRRGEILTSDKHCVALGFSEDFVYECDDRVQLESGDVLLAFTDGLIEAHSVSDREQLFGEERVRKLLLEHAAKGSSAEAITRALAEAAYQFAGGQHEDDITLVVVRKR